MTNVPGDYNVSVTETGNSGPHIPDWDGSPNVVAYRMQRVEQQLNGMEHKLDLMAQNFVTTTILHLTLEPLRSEVASLKANANEEETRRKNTSAQLRLALAIAVSSPVISILVSVVLLGRAE